MKKIIFLIIAAGGFISVTCQETKTVTLNDCYRDALANSPVYGEKPLLGQVSQLKDKNIETGWYPSIEAGASVMYNTDVVDFASVLDFLPVPVPPGEISGMPHDQYRLTVDINQVIYDGGAIKGSREVENASLMYDEAGVEADLYRVREQVNNTFFTLILLRKELALLQSFRELIKERMNAVNTAVENGVLLPADYDIIRSEKVKTDQQITSIEIQISALFSVLSDLTGREYDKTTLLIMPELDILPESTITRPELELFDLKAKQLEAGKALVKSTRMPKAFGFATLGYGSPPGNDFFNDSFGPYAVLGAGIKWTITDWNRAKRNNQMIDLNKSIIESRKYDLEGSLRRSLEVKRSEIEKLTSMLESDEELISIRKSVTEATEVKLNNGVISATDYLTELNAEKQAMINRELHLVTLERAKADYLFIIGKEIEN